MSYLPFFFFKRLFNFISLFSTCTNIFTEKIIVLIIFVFCFLALPHRTLSGSSCLSETGSLDRGKSALERRKKAAEESVTSGRVEITRVNTDSIIEQLIKSTNLEPSDETTSCKWTLKKNFFIFISFYLTCTSICQFVRWTLIRYVSLANGFINLI